MDNQEDKKLFELLDHYSVQDADQSLLNNIIERANKSKKVAKKFAVNDNNKFYYNRKKQLLVFTVIAVIGFLIGSQSLIITNNSRQNAVNLDKMIFGPTSVYEVIL